MALHEREKLADDRADKTADNLRADKEAEAKAQYLRAIAGKADKYVPASQGIGASTVGRLPEVDKIRLNGLQRNEDRIMALMGNPNFDPNAPMAKQLNMDLADTRQQIDDMLRRYGSGSPQGVKSPLGLFPSQGSDGGAAAPSKGIEGKVAASSPLSRGLMLPAPQPKVTTEKLNELATAAGITRVPGVRGNDRYIRKIGDGRRQVEMSRSELAEFLKVPY
ncbi:MAG: hypothetical protein RI907_3811 [Pseudomonadota bacterium]|jgi:hypothetical protein